MSNLLTFVYLSKRKCFWFKKMGWLFFFFLIVVRGISYCFITYSINIFPDTVHFSPCDTGIWVMIRGKKERDSHNLINKSSTSKMAIKYVINRLNILHVFCHIITRISPKKTSISPSQARGDMGISPTLPTGIIACYSRSCNKWQYMTTTNLDGHWLTILIT